MRILNRIWKNIKSGENVDQYITIIVAITLAILNITGVSVQSNLIPFILAVLALISINTLGNRFKIEELLEKNSGSLNSFLMEEFPTSYKTDFEKSDVMWLVGVSLHRTIKTNYLIIEQKLRQGKKIRVLLVHPHGIGVELSVARNYAHRGVEPKSNDILFILELLCSLKSIAPDNLEMRTISFPLAYGATFIEPDRTKGRLYIEHYGFRVSTDSIPRYVLNATDGQWYEFYKKELESLWNTGQEWSCNNIGNG